MGRDLKSFRKSGAGAGKSGAGFSSADMAKMDAEGIINEYGGKSESELMAELMRVTGEQKQAGTFDPAGMRTMANSLLPMLNEEQKRKLNGILEMLGRS